jgi:nucleoid-associated protein YgaU
VEAESAMRTLGETAASLKETAQQVGTFARAHKNEAPLAKVAKHVGFEQPDLAVKPKSSGFSFTKPSASGSSAALAKPSALAKPTFFEKPSTLEKPEAFHSEPSALSTPIEFSQPIDADKAKVSQPDTKNVASGKSSDGGFLPVPRPGVSIGGMELHTNAGTNQDAGLKSGSAFQLPKKSPSSFKPISTPTQAENKRSFPAVEVPLQQPKFQPLRPPADQPLRSPTTIEANRGLDLKAKEPVPHGKTLVPQKPESDLNTAGNQRLISTTPSMADLRPVSELTVNSLGDPNRNSSRKLESEPESKPVVADARSALIPIAANESKVAAVGFEETIEYEIKSGDSFWSIAHERYGDGRLFSALYLQNEARVPGFEDLTPGVRIEIPPRAELIRRWRGDVPADIRHENDPWRATPDDLMEKLTTECDKDLKSRFYVTLPGDTLFAIAGQRLGQASRYVELIELNQFRLAPDTDQLSPLPKGLRLVLPE